MNDTKKPPFDSFFTKSKRSLIFNGDNLICRIPHRYSIYGVLTYSDIISSLGIFQITINNQYSYGLVLPAVITIEPSSIYKEKDKESDIDYIVGELYNNDKFISDTTVLQQTFLANVIFKEFIKRGKKPKFLDYVQMATLFDNVGKVCGFNPRINHAVFELIYAHLFRDKDNLHIKYRHTDMYKDPEYIGLTNVAYGTDSTTAKLIGSYLSTSLDSAITNQSEENHEMEDLLRS